MLCSMHVRSRWDAPGCVQEPEEEARTRTSLHRISAVRVTLHPSYICDTRWQSDIGSKHLLVVPAAVE